MGLDRHAFRRKISATKVFQGFCLRSNVEIPEPYSGISGVIKKELELAKSVSADGIQNLSNLNGEEFIHDYQSTSSKQAIVDQDIHFIPDILVELDDGAFA